MRKRLILWTASVLIALLALAPLAQAQSGPAAPAAPARMGQVTVDGEVSAAGTVGALGGSPGTWYVGATPPNVDYSKPVLLFVHGKGGWAGSWWEATVYHGTNDMYAYAYYNGYRTAFVDLYPEASMWTNGDLLRRQIDAVTAYFGVNQVTIVAHSKGGVDSNSASVHYGANPKIKRIITLGSPHWGSPVADMAYSTWTWWLAALLGQRNDATYVLQTGYMSYFRSITDGRDTNVPYYTLSGYKCGPLFSALWMGCVAISGEDDGLVPVWSARIPGGTHLKEGYWDHDEIRMGSRTWSWFAPVIQTAGTTQAVALAGNGLAAAGRRPDVGLGGGGAPAAPGNLLLRGGDTAGAGSREFPLESGVRKASFTFFASSPDFTATLTGPDGSAVTVATTMPVAGSEFLAGSYTGTVELAAPAAGHWSIATDAPGKAGWLMAASLDSDLQALLSLDSSAVAPGAHKALSVGFSGVTPASSQAEAAVSLDRQTHTRIALSRAANGRLQGSLTAPAGNGVHNVTVTVTGTLPDGTTFERTLFSSFATGTPAPDRGSAR